jgi:hypothetical protein
MFKHLEKITPAVAPSALTDGLDITTLAKVMCYQYWLGYYTGKNMTTPDAEKRAMNHLHDANIKPLEEKGFKCSWVQGAEAIISVVSNVSS